MLLDLTDHPTLVTDTVKSRQGLAILGFQSYQLVDPPWRIMDTPVNYKDLASLGGQVDI